MAGTKSPQATLPDGGMSFDSVTGLLCTQDGSTLYFSDYYHHRVGRINLKTRSVVGTWVGSCRAGTVDGDGGKGWMDSPRSLCFDCSPTVKPESIIYLAQNGGIRQIETATGRCMSPSSSSSDPERAHRLCLILRYASDSH